MSRQPKVSETRRQDFEFYVTCFNSAVNAGYRGQYENARDCIRRMRELADTGKKLGASAEDIENALTTFLQSRIDVVVQAETAELKARNKAWVEAARINREATEKLAEQATKKGKGGKRK